MKVFVCLSLLALASANPVRPDEAAAQAQQQAQLNGLIAQNNHLHGAQQAPAGAVARSLVFAPAPQQYQVQPALRYAPVQGAVYQPAFHAAPAVALATPTEQAQLAKQQADLLGLIATNARLHGAEVPAGYHVAPSFRGQPVIDFTNVRPEDRAALLKQQADLAGIVAQAGHHF